MAGIVRRVTRAALVVLALGGGAETAAAQGRWLRLPDAGYFGMGIAGMATGELDDELAARGHPTFGRRAGAPGIGAYWSLPGGLTIGGEWNGLVLGEEESHEGREVGLGGGYGTVGVGYLVEISPRARVYPRLGIGGGGMGLWSQPEEEEIGFDDALTNPGPAPEPERVLSRGSMVVDLGAGVELLAGGSGRRPMIGLRFGYLATPVSTDWSLKHLPFPERPVTGGPAATIAGPYLRVIVGTGRLR